MTTMSEIELRELRRDRAGKAALLSLLAPGLGQIYGGHWLWAIFWLIITPGFWIGTAGLFGWPFHILAALQARKQVLRGY